MTKAKDIGMQQKKIKPSEDLIFNDKVREQCRSCKRYGKKATCPPYVEDVSYYSTLLTEYKYGTIYYEEFERDENWEEKGKDSSLAINNVIISERNSLFLNGHYFAVGFGAGSCKLCDTCAFPCRMPNKSLIPIEGTGMNIVEMMSKLGVKVEFPINDSFYRIGMLLYD